MGNGMIKVITGMRRCGKSYLLFELFRNHLLQNGVSEDQIVSIEFDRLRNEHLRDPHKACRYIDSCVKDSRQYYLLLDEVQFLRDFEAVLNDYLHESNLDIYVTGSNSHFLSTDILTEFRGRGDEIHVHPLSFYEFYSAFSGSKEDAWREYSMYGGLPQVALMDKPETKVSFLKKLFQKVYIADILERHSIHRNKEELEELLQVLASSLGSLTNTRKLSCTFKSVKGKTVSPSILDKYCGYFKEAFLLDVCKRYDIKGKHYINSIKKYYFEDIGLRNALLNFRQMEASHIMENIIYNELLGRGYNVDVGIVEIRSGKQNGEPDRKLVEIDFVANLGSQRYYLQSALTMPTTDKQKQEYRPLIHVNDSFKKIIVTCDNTLPWHDEKGILIINIMDFLLDANSLEK